MVKRIRDRREEAPVLSNQQTKSKTRYATFGFMREANLDDGATWPITFALKELSAAEEARVAALVKKAASWESVQASAAASALAPRPTAGKVADHFTDTFKVEDDGHAARPGEKGHAVIYCQRIGVVDFMTVSTDGRHRERPERHALLKRQDCRSKCFPVHRRPYSHV